MDSFLMTCLLIIVPVVTINGYSTGAPKGACKNLMPNHEGAVAQTTTSPYSISVSSTTYKPGETITVTVKGELFKGLILQARSSSDDTTPIGTFTIPSTNTKTTKCTSDSDTWTHSNSTNKREGSANWTAPSTNMGDITFRATIVQTKLKFWTNHEKAVSAQSGIY
ncbi:hypothetical protein SNE40_022801 [Patella caerulea]|uniref:Reelin domain-containing protein n=1 Tax=Patella caerulea TaxID=87958 RepID=A0AAN8IZW9_PATCE